jgi:hypothetical protein
MNCKADKRHFLTRLQTEEWDNSAKRKKTSFWASDCKKTMAELYWAWIDEPETNPCEAETLIMFKAAKLFELAIMEKMVKFGLAADLENDEVVAALGVNLAENKDEFGKRQARMEMEREFVPVTGYLDGLTTTGEPIEVKSYYSAKVDRDLANGKPPSEHYLHQLAVYMDFLGKDRGYLVSVNRSTGAIFFNELVHLGGLVYSCGEHSDALLGEESDDEGHFGDDDEGFVGETTVFDLSLEYKRWRKLFEDNIHPRKEPPLDYEYRPEITRELLGNYPVDKIKKAIKGQRVLSDHRWRPQYSRWKNLWIKKECEAKGFASEADLCRYTESDIELMMDFLDVEWKMTKAGPKLYKKKNDRKKS